MNPATLEAQILEESAAAVRTARDLGGPALPVLSRHSKSKNSEVRFIVASCAESLAQIALPDNDRAALVDLCILMTADDDEQTAAVAAMTLFRLEPKGCADKLRVAFAAAKIEFARARIPMIVAFDAGPADQAAWEALVPITADGEILDGLHTGLARMGSEPSRRWFAAKLLSTEGTHSEEWFDRAVYMRDPWIYTTLRRCLEKRDHAYTANADTVPVVIRVQDLAAWAVLTMTKKPVKFAVAKRRYTESELDEIKTIAAELAP